MGFFEWISGIFGSNSSEENKDNENISIDSDLRNEVKGVEHDMRGENETPADQISGDSMEIDITESDKQDLEDQRVTENDLQSQENDETQA